MFKLLVIQGMDRARMMEEAGTIGQTARRLGACRLQEGHRAGWTKALPSIRLGCCIPR